MEMSTADLEKAPSLSFLPRLPSLLPGPSTDLSFLLDGDLRTTASGMLDSFLAGSDVRVPNEGNVLNKTSAPAGELQSPDATVSQAMQKMLDRSASQSAGGHGLPKPEIVFNASPSYPPPPSSLSTDQPGRKRDLASKQSGTMSAASSFLTEDADDMDDLDEEGPSHVDHLDNNDEYVPGLDDELGLRDKRMITRSDSRRSSTRNTSLTSTDTQAVLRGLRRQHEEEYGAQASGQKEKRKVGRPIAYKGDPNSAELTEEERRRIKRRIANRESARRVRQKRLGMMDELQIKIEAMQTHNQRLVQHVTDIQNQRQLMLRQMQAMRDQWSAASCDNSPLQAEVDTLRCTLEITMQRNKAQLQGQPQGQHQVQRQQQRTLEQQQQAAEPMPQMPSLFGELLPLGSSKAMSDWSMFPTVSDAAFLPSLEPDSGAGTAVATGNCGQ